MTSISSKNKFNQILTDLDHFKKKDFSYSAGRILGSMCTTPHPIAQEAFARFIDTNIGDPGLSPGTKQVENLFLDFIKTMVHAPPSSTGHVVSGGTEGNITAMWVVKQLTKNREVLVPSSVHFSFRKIASLLDMRITTIPLTKDYIMDVTELKKRISNRSAAVVGIAGSTDLGAIDPLDEIGEICADHHLFFHVDAAFGGFIIPFLRSQGYDLPRFDLDIPAVSSLSIDAHKMGQAAIPLGTLILREAAWLDLISVPSPCITSPTQSGLLGTRSGGPVAAAYAVTQYLGQKGYETITHNCMAATSYMIKRLHDIGLEVLIEHPPLNVIGVKLHKMQEIVNRLEQRGWRVNAMPHLNSIRLVIMPHVTIPVIDAFISELKNICKEVGE
jgi:tyrosine decarboxylase/aspartate 1-decarboxylase